MERQYMTRPTARPRQAPIAMVGRKIPAGTYQGLSAMKLTGTSERTIMPNVHAVRKTLMVAVRMSRKTFCHSAVGLQQG